MKKATVDTDTVIITYTQYKLIQKLIQGHVISEYVHSGRAFIGDGLGVLTKKVDDETFQHLKEKKLLKQIIFADKDRRYYEYNDAVKFRSI